MYRVGLAAGFEQCLLRWSLKKVVRGALDRKDSSDGMLVEEVKISDN